MSKPNPSTKRSAFGEWFRAQFGSLPNPTKRAKLGMQIRNLESELHYLRVERQKQDWLADTYNGALKAWTARK